MRATPYAGWPSFVCARYGVLGRPNQRREEDVCPIPIEAATTRLGGVSHREEARLPEQPMGGGHVKVIAIVAAVAQVDPPHVTGRVAVPALGLRAAAGALLVPAAGAPGVVRVGVARSVVPGAHPRTSPAPAVAGAALQRATGIALVRAEAGESALRRVVGEERLNGSPKSLRWTRGLSPVSWIGRLGRVYGRCRRRTPTGWRYTW